MHLREATIRNRIGLRRTSVFLLRIEGVERREVHGVRRSGEGTALVSQTTSLRPNAHASHEYQRGDSPSCESELDVQLGVRRERQKLTIRCGRCRR